MRLVYTLPDFWPHVRRGSERIVHDLALEMSRRGHHVTVYTRDPARRGRQEGGFGFSVRYRAGSRLVERALRLDPLEGFALTAAAAVVRQPADLYHAFYLTDAYGLSLGTRMRRRPFVFSWHGLPGADWWEANEPRTHHWYRRAVARAARVTVMAVPSAAAMLRDYGREVSVVAPGIFTSDYARARAADATPTIVYAAALDDPRKRHDVAIGAFALLLREGVVARLLLIGQGDRAPLQALLDAQPQDVRRLVEIAPAVADIGPVYARCAVGLLTSKEEAFGLVVAEYLASGMPAVVSDDGGAAEIISAGTGMTFNAGDGADCARALREALALADHASTEERCRARARDFDWATRGDAYEAMYREVLEAAG